MSSIAKITLRRIFRGTGKHNNKKCENYMMMKKKVESL
jgi:hypothetical protein